MKLLHRYGYGLFNKFIYVSVNLVRPLNLSNRATMLSSVHLSWRSPYMLRGSSIAPVTFGQSAGCVSSFDIFGHSSLFFPSTLLLFLPLMFLLYLSLSIIISSTILPSWDCNIFTDFRFTSFVSGHTFVIRNRSRVATSLTGGSPTTLTQLFVPQRR